MVLPEELKEIEIFTKFMGERLERKGFISTPRGNEFFRNPVEVGGRIMFRAPHGHYDTIVKYYDGKMQETTQD